MSNELSTPKILFCPAEMDGSSRMAATTFASSVVAGTASQIPFTNNNNISYFVGWDAQETYPQMFLDGDHSMGAGASTANTPASTAWKVTAQQIGTNNVLAAWTDSSQHQKQGNVGLADGSVQGYSISGLKNAAANTGDTYHTATGTLPAGVNRLLFP
jgi:prepilin-type processing-associated H-X9-DG protein